MANEITDSAAPNSSVAERWTFFLLSLTQIMCFLVYYIGLLNVDYIADYMSNRECSWNQKLL